MKKTPINRANSGFTLLELIVATAISVLILVLIIRVVVSMLGQVDRSLAVESRSSEIEKVQAYLKADIESIYYTDEWKGSVALFLPGDGWSTEGWDSVNSDSKPAATAILDTAMPTLSMDGERWGKEGVQLQLLVNDPAKGRDDPGGIKAVAYQIKRRSVASEKEPRYFLMRSEVSAAQTLKTGYRFEDSDYVQGSYSDRAFWAPLVIRHPNENHVIAANVIDFGIRAFARDVSTGNWEMVFPGNSNRLTEGLSPELWVIMIRVLSDQGAELIQNIEQGRMNDDWWQTAVQHSQQITFKVARPM